MGCDRPSKLWLVLPGIYSNLTHTNTPIGKMFLAALLKFWCVKSHGSVLYVSETNCLYFEPWLLFSCILQAAWLASSSWMAHCSEHVLCSTVSVLTVLLRANIWSTRGPNTYSDATHTWCPGYATDPTKARNHTHSDTQAIIPPFNLMCVHECILVFLLKGTWQWLFLHGFYLCMCVRVIAFTFFILWFENYPKSILCFSGCKTWSMILNLRKICLLPS